MVSNKLAHLKWKSQLGYIWNSLRSKQKHKCQKKWYNKCSLDLMTSLAQYSNGRYKSVS